MSADVTRSGPSQAEQREITRLLRKHSDIAKHGAGVQETMAEKAALQTRRKEFVLKHGIACFICGTRMNKWAKCGGSAPGHRPWAICVQCVRKPRT